MARFASLCAAGGLAALRRFIADVPAVESCDLCGASLPEEHDHVVAAGREPPGQNSAAARLLIRCVCRTCAVLFGSSGETKYRRAPRVIRYLADFQLTDAQWATLMLPVAIVFFVRSSLSPKVTAFYPSPGGAAETFLDSGSWQAIVSVNPVLDRMQPDVEALLVNRAQGARDHFIAPIDECYRLTGLIRRYWRGFSSGERAWNEIAAFFAGQKQRAAGPRTYA